MAFQIFLLSFHLPALSTITTTRKVHMDDGKFRNKLMFGITLTNPMVPFIGISCHLFRLKDGFSLL